MRMSLRTNLVRGTVVAAVILAACSDATGPGATEPRLTPSSLVPAFVWTGPAGGEVEPGKLKVCNVWDGASGGIMTLSASFFDNFANGTLSRMPAPYSIPANGCTVIATSTEPFMMDELDGFSGLDIPPAQRVSAERFYSDVGESYGGGMIVGWNAQRGATIVFTYKLLAAPPNTGCTNTTTWYRTKGSESITLVLDARQPDSQRAIFAATPGKTGGVTWDGGKEVLDLYQQLLAAWNNVGGYSDAGPADVDAAIAGALAVTAGYGTNIDLVGTPTKREIKALIDILSAFNAGKYDGWARCSR